MLYQLSYTPRFALLSVTTAYGHHPTVGRFGLPVLFSLLTVALALIAYASADHGQWVIAIPAIAITLWMGSTALASLRRTRR